MAGSNGRKGIPRIEGIRRGGVQGFSNIDRYHEFPTVCELVVMR